MEALVARKYPRYVALINQIDPPCFQNYEPELGRKGNGDKDYRSQVARATHKWVGKQFE